MHAIEPVEVEPRPHPAGQSLARDEARDARGRPRAPYRRLAARFGFDPLAPGAALRARLDDRPLGDDARILPVPLALDAREHAAIRRGVRQRALALHAFFSELVAGGGPVAGCVDADVVERVLAAAGGELRRAPAGDDVAFVYGPDIARGPDGAWVVIEDNVGCVGGIADGWFVGRAYARAASLPEADPASADLVRALTRWRALLGDPPDGWLAAMPGCGPGDAAVVVEEDRRRAELLRLAGARMLDGVAVPSAGTDPDPPTANLGGRPPAANLGARPPAANLGARLPTATANFGAPPLAAIANFGALPPPSSGAAPRLLNSPGTGLLGDKALLPYVDEMIRRTSGDEPLLRSAATLVQRDGALPEPPMDWVVKTATGCGGDGVHVLGTRDADDAARASMHAAGLGGTVAQRWIDCSTLPWGPSRIELRPIAYVLGRDEVFVGEQLVGKAVLAADRRALNNVSRGARYVAVLVAENG